MQPYIEVKFERMSHDVSVVASAQRWVARLQSAGISIRGAFLTIEAARRGTKVCLKLEHTCGSASTASTARDDVYVAVADAFRAARRQVLECTVSGSPGRFALVFAA